MNAVEIEEAVSALAERPFDAAEFPFLFLEAFGNKEATIKKLRAGASNKSDIGGLLQVSNIHLKVAEAGTVGAVLDALRTSEDDPPPLKWSALGYVLERFKNALTLPSDAGPEGGASRFLTDACVLRGELSVTKHLGSAIKISRSGYFYLFLE